MPSWSKWGVSIIVAIALVGMGWRWTVLLVTLHILVSFLLVIVVMLQSGTAADLAGAFGGAGSQTAFGPRGAATFLSRATTWCAIVFMMTSLALSVKRSPTTVSTGSILEQTSAPAPEKSKSAPPAKAPASAPAKSAPAAPTNSPKPAEKAPPHK